MASLGHIFVGVAAGRAWGGPRVWRPMLAFSALSFLPDLDVIGFRFGVAYGDPWGHRGASHSVVFGVAVALVVALLARLGDVPWRRALLFAAPVVVSHGFLDTLTTGGLGSALWWPFSDARHFAPWRPIPVSPIGRAFFGARGLRVALTEVVLFAPFWIYALWPRRRAEPRG